jgi:carbamoyl-phosphate synthase large subunit
MSKTKVLIAGTAGASLGTEVLKCLLMTGNYEIHGCDISPLSYGHYHSGFAHTFVPSTETYIADIINYCLKRNITYIIPGGEVPLSLLLKQRDDLHEKGLVLAGNSYDVIAKFSDKAQTFAILADKGFAIPYTLVLATAEDVKRIPNYPCIIKPATGSGGSASVFLVNSAEEAMLYFELLQKSNTKIIVQEYIPLDEGEFTIGVLTLPDSTAVGSIVMKRIFTSKLSIAFVNKIGLISSGYSQGLIGNFPELAQQAIEMSQAIRSQGPINIQARVQDGRLMPFEINPRFSASTYLRALAGFNEVDFFLRHLIYGEREFKFTINEGYYLRSFEEQYVPLEKIKSNEVDQ